MRSINVSSNELRALLKRCFEVLSAGNQDYDDLARLVVWLEMNGLPGIDNLLEAATDIESRTNWPLAFTQSGSKTQQITADGASLLGFACNVTDMAIAMAASDGASRIEIVGCAHALAVIPCVARCGRRNLNAMAIWRDDRSDRLHITSVQAGDSLPDYRIVATTADVGLSENTLVLRCSQTTDMMDYDIPGTVDDTGNLLTHITAPEFASRYALSRDEGIAVSADKLHALSIIADRILVEATEESRRGAGEQVGSNTG